MGLNLKAITNIQRQADILSDGHQDVVDQAVVATVAVTVIDDCMTRAKEARRPPVGLSTYARQACQQLDMLKEQLQAQAERAHRVYAEIEQIKKNLIID
jgi:molecular chaperone GrpE (heat shock protein)